MLAKPSFDVFPLACDQDPLPFHGARALAVFSHQVRSLVKDMDQIRRGAPKLEGRGCRVVFLHLTARIAAAFPGVDLALALADPRTPKSVQNWSQNVQLGAQEQAVAGYKNPGLR